MARDLRKYAHQTTLRLIAGGLLLLFLVGDGLILLIYGKGPALMGLTCLLLAMVPVLVVMFIFMILDWIKKRADIN